MLVEGTLERFAAAGGAINVLVDKVGSIAAPDQVLAEVKDFSLLDEQVRRGRAEQQAARTAIEARAENADGTEARAANADGTEARADDADGTEAEDFRAVAPPVMSFASGRRR
jgi:hypothetical protein